MWTRSFVKKQIIIKDELWKKDNCEIAAPSLQIKGAPGKEVVEREQGRGGSWGEEKSKQ